ncbi:MAG TPA: helix-turn-helix domain-containing protein [Candidatus Peribacteraceae bacterium]|nr:helix-turn-helix domain-containing protein [Candidatus Peribacteraceae bacterium]
MLTHYLAKLDFTEKERAIYLVLAELGVQPASVIARRCDLDRITTYKHLKKLAERGFVKTYFREGVQCFGIESFDAIEEYLKNGAEKYEALMKQFPTALNILQSMRSQEDIIPKLQMFEGEAGIKSLFRDMLHELTSSELKQLRMLSSNTFEERVEDEPLSKTVRAFFEDLRKRKIQVELFEATGGLVPEHLKKVPPAELDLSRLPIARGTSNIFVAGHAVYLATYKGGQVGLKIKQAELSQIFHFIFDLLGREQWGRRQKTEGRSQ